jgi:hypothetical protein
MMIRTFFLSPSACEVLSAISQRVVNASLS